MGTLQEDFHAEGRARLRRVSCSLFADKQHRGWLPEESLAALDPEHLTDFQRYTRFRFSPYFLSEFHA